MTQTNYSTDRNAALKILAQLIKMQYDFNGYEISPEKLVEMANIIHDVGSNYNISFDKTTKFFNELKCGIHGTLYRMPSDLISKYWKFVDANRRKLA